MFTAHHLLWYPKQPNPFKLVSLSVFLVAVKCIFNRLSSFSCTVIHIKLFRDKPVSEHGLRTSNPPTPPQKSGTKKGSSSVVNTVPLLYQHENQGVLRTSVWLQRTTWVIWDYESYSVQQEPRLHHTPTDKETFSQTEVTTSACLWLSTELKLGQSFFLFSILFSLFFFCSPNVQQMWLDQVLTDFRGVNNLHGGEEMVADMQPLTFQTLQCFQNFIQWVCFTEFKTAQRDR